MKIEGSTPHPVLLPMGEGTMLQRLCLRSLSQREGDRVRGGTIVRHAIVKLARAGDAR